MRRLAAVLLAALVAAPVAATAAVRVGDAAPAVAFTDAAGATVGLDRFRGRVVLLDFTASWCVACRSALPALDALGRRWADRGVIVVTVAIDAARRDADRFLADVVPERAMTILYDPSTLALARFGAAGLPALYLIDGSGIVRAIESGYDAARVAAFGTVVERVLAEHPVPGRAPQQPGVPPPPAAAP